MSKLDIPQDQLDRILPTVEPLLEDLRLRTKDLSPQSDPALIYQLDNGAAE